jgi:hypothetical protein
MSSRWTGAGVERHGALPGVRQDRCHRCHREFPRDAETLWIAIRQSTESLPGWSVTTADRAHRRLEAAVHADAVGWLTGVPGKHQVAL